MTRDEAEKLYVNKIMEHGNPRYFVFKVIHSWSEESLLECMENIGIEETPYELEEDEEE